MISLFGLIIVLGIVVDDAVVVGENVITEQERWGQNTAATLRGVRGVFSPVTIGVLTTMAAFAPLLFVTGTFGQILGSVPIVVILVLTMSLLEVFFILPAHLSHGQAWSKGPLIFRGGLVAASCNFEIKFFCRPCRCRTASLSVLARRDPLAGGSRRPDEQRAVVSFSSRI